MPAAAPCASVRVVRSRPHDRVAERRHNVQRPAAIGIADAHLPAFAHAIRPHAPGLVDREGPLRRDAQRRPVGREGLGGDQDRPAARARGRAILVSTETLASDRPPLRIASEWTLAVDKPWRVGANGVCEGGQVRVGNAYGSRTLDVVAPFCDPVVRP